MATSGTIQTNTTYSSYFWVKWSQSSQDITNNRTKINWSCGVYCGHNFYTNAIRMDAVKINGTQVYAGGTYYSNFDKGNHTISSGSMYINHNSDGTKTFTVNKFTGWLYDSYDYSAAAKSFTLTTIPRASTITATTANIGSNTTITIARASSSFTHTITWSCGSKSGTIVKKTTKTSLTWSVPDSIYETIPNAKTATVTLTCITYNGSSTVGTTTKTFTAKAVESACKPTISGGTIIDVNTKSTAVTSANTTLLLYVSNAQISGISVTKNKNAGSITSIKFNCGKTSVNVTNGTATINAMQSSTFTVVATDSRGYSTTKTFSPTVIDYVVPTITAKCSRTNTTSNTINATFKGAIFGNTQQSFAQWNFTVKYKWRIKGGTWSDFITVNSVKSNNTYSNGSSAITLGTNFDYQNAYEFIFKVEDPIYDASATAYTIATKTITVMQGTPVFDFGESDFNFNVPAKYKGVSLFYLPGDTITITSTEKQSWSAFTSNGNKNLYITIPIAKPIVNVNTVTLTGSFTARGPDGYLMPESESGIDIGTDYSAYITPFGINVIRRFSETISGVSNNRPVSVLPQTGFQIVFS